MEGEGWQISEVVALLGMGRRAIQRSCGQNLVSGDLGIVRVGASKPGRRSYDADELAQLHLVNVMNQDGMDLVSVRDAFLRAQDTGGMGVLARSRREAGLERAEAAEARLLRDRAHGQAGVGGARRARGGRRAGEGRLRGAVSRRLAPPPPARGRLWQHLAGRRA